MIKHYAIAWCLLALLWTPVHGSKEAPTFEEVQKYTTSLVSILDSSIKGTLSNLEEEDLSDLSFNGVPGLRGANDYLAALSRFYEEEWDRYTKNVIDYDYTAPIPLAILGISYYTSWCKLACDASKAAKYLLQAALLEVANASEHTLARDLLADTCGDLWTRELKNLRLGSELAEDMLTAVEESLRASRGK